MKGQDLIDRYPKATLLLKGSIVEKMEKGFDISEENNAEFLNEIIKNRVDYLLINMIENSPHSLFELFDANSIYISIIVRHTKSGISFNYRIVPRDKKNASRSSKSRRDVESYAIEDAFETLENSL